MVFMSVFPAFGRARNLIAGFLRANEGNLAVIFAIAAIPVIGSIGTAVDFAKVNDVTTHLQAALDAAVLAGVKQPSAQQISTASAIFSGDFNGKYGATATASFVQNANGSLSGIASSSVKASFLGVFGISSIPANAAATATLGTTSGAQTTSSVCILLVNALDSQALLVNSNGQITAPNCEIDVLSTQSPAAIFDWASSDGKPTPDVENICIKGSTIIKNGGANPPVQTGCAAISDPFAGTLPKVTVGACNFNNQVYNPGTVTLNPGVYCGWTNFNGSGSLTLNPGLYVIQGGGMTFNSGWSVTGTGVTFYLVDQNATITFNGNVNANLSAPTSGTYANILMFEPTGLSNTNLPINGTSGSSFTGLIYLPSRDVTINSVSNVTANNVTMVFSTLILDATNWSIAPGALSMSRATGSGTATTAYLSK
jgi:Flp pilus assembly protein TadG